MIQFKKNLMRSAFFTFMMDLKMPSSPSPKKGASPHSMIYSITPQLHTSASRPYFCLMTYSIVVRLEPDTTGAQQPLTLRARGCGGGGLAGLRGGGVAWGTDTVGARASCASRNRSKWASAGPWKDINHNKHITTSTSHTTSQQAHHPPPGRCSRGCRAAR
jgi:hypothetical protein